jgi:hypothetical protein
VEVNGVCRGLEDRQLARFHTFRDAKASRTERNPANGVVDRRLVAPGLASPQAHSQIIH